MTTTDLDGRLRRVIAESFALPEASIHEETSMDSLKEWDSVSHLTLMLAIETAFAVTLSMDEMARMTSLAQARSVLRARLG